MEYKQIHYTLEIITKRKTLIKKEILAYEPKHLDTELAGIHLVIHHEYAGYRQKPNWLVSEYITGLRITTIPRRTRNLALADAIRLIKSYGIEKFKKLVNNGENLFQQPS